jgi:hypothetical protein
MPWSAVQATSQPQSSSFNHGAALYYKHNDGRSGASLTKLGVFIFQTLGPALMIPGFSALSPNTF